VMLFMSRPPPSRDPLAIIGPGHGALLRRTEGINFDSQSYVDVLPRSHIRDKGTRMSCYITSHFDPKTSLDDLTSMCKDLVKMETHG